LNRNESEESLNQSPGKDKNSKEARKNRLKEMKKKFKKNYIDFGTSPEREMVDKMLVHLKERNKRDRIRKPTMVEKFNRLVLESDITRLKVLDSYFDSVVEKN